MSVFVLEEVNNIFACSNGSRVIVSSVPSPNLQIFNRNITTLFSKIGEDGRDDFWSPIVSELKRIRFDLSAAPLSKEIISEKAKTLNTKLKNKEKYCEMVYSSDLADILNQLADQAQKLSDNAETNLLDFLVSLVSENKSTDLAIAISNPRLIPLVEETIQHRNELRTCNLVSPSNLKEATCFSCLFIIGAPRWFPEFIFSSPRSPELHIIKHKWISGKWSPKFLLISPYKTHGHKTQPLEIEDDTSNFVYDDPEELIPNIDIKKIQDNATEQLINLVGDEDDVVKSRLFLLENDWAVFLDADDNSSVDIIDLDEDIKRRVRRANVREIQPGTFVLLRTEGGGDYIVPVADVILGKLKEKARYDQKRWKVLLKEHVKKKGHSNVINELRQLGSNRATYLNLCHWMSFRGIKTESYDDFIAIMKLIGLEKESKQLWETMSTIRTAHTKAGFTIRNMLLDLINKSDLDTLKRHGKMDFELAEQGAGSLSAFRVVEVAKEITEVIHWRIGEPFRIDTDNG